MKQTIAFYSNAFYTGGMENAVFNLIQMLNYSKKYEFYIVAELYPYKGKSTERSVSVIVDFLEGREIE
jgi:predicted ABC-type exoprotein transport system permease subunit